MKYKFEFLEIVNQNSEKAREKERKKVINRLKRLVKNVK